MSPHTAAFARRLQAESGHAVCCVVDERRGAVDVGPFDKIALTLASCRSLGLYCPRDVGWRCGDYGFYLARRRFPAERFFWLIEFDVRLSGPDIGEFFRPLDARESVDLISGRYGLAERSWYWTHTMAARGAAVWRCLFPVVRLSAAAIDLLHVQRKAYARRPVRLANWPNDESFVATVLSRAGLSCADLNDFGRELYDDSSYTFDVPIDGQLHDDRAAPTRVFHPVLFGDDLARKVKRMAWIEKGESLPRKVKRRVIDAINRRSAA